jgi:hypothetical protein
MVDDVLGLLVVVLTCCCAALAVAWLLSLLGCAGQPERRSEAAPRIRADGDVESTIDQEAREGTSEAESVQGDQITHRFGMDEGMVETAKHFSDSLRTFLSVNLRRYIGVVIGVIVLLIGVPIPPNRYSIFIMAAGGALIVVSLVLL